MQFLISVEFFTDAVAGNNCKWLQALKFFLNHLALFPLESAVNYIDSNNKDVLLQSDIAEYNK